MPSGTKITDIKTTIVEGNFDWGIVKIETDSGINGYGECFSALQSKAIREIVLSTKEILVGEDPLDVGRLTAKVWMAKSYIGGLITQAISGIDIALWDIAGKSLDVPTYRLLGGKFREKVRIYADCHAGHPITHAWEDYTLAQRESYTPEAFAEHAKKVTKSFGFDFLKFDLYPELTPLAYPHNQYEGHMSNEQIAYMARLIGAVRETVGDRVELAVDLGGYSTHDAIRLGNALEPFKLAWMEDVVPNNAENVDALIEVTRLVKTPTLTGENLYNRNGFRDLIVRQAVRIVSPDLGTVGGLTEAGKVADLAGAYYIPLAPHNIASPIGTLAACQLCAAISNFIALEFHATGVSWWEDMIKGDKPIIKNGFIDLPRKPGIGVEPDIDVINQNLKKAEQPLD